MSRLRLVVMSFVAALAVAAPAHAAVGPGDSIRVVHADGPPKPLVLARGYPGLFAFGALAWTSDGRSLLAHQDRRFVRLTGRRRTVLARLPTDPGESAFSRDGRLAVADVGRAVVRILGDGAPSVAVRLARDPHAYVGSIAWSADGTRVAASVSRFRGSDSIVLLDPSTGAVTARLRTPDYVATMAWSPDGRRLATSSDTQDVNWEIAEIDLASRSRRLLTVTDSAQEDGSPALRADGTMAFTEFGAVRVGDRRIRTPGLVPTSLAWSPDGRRLAVAFFDDDGRPRLGVLDPSEPDPRPRILDAPYTQYVEQIAWSPDGARIAYAATWPG